MTPNIPQGGINPRIDCVLPTSDALSLEAAAEADHGTRKGARSDIIREAIAFYLWARANDKTALGYFRAQYEPEVVQGWAKGRKRKEPGK